MNAPPAIPWRPASFWHASGQRLVCTLCPFRCALAEDGPGRCQVRRRRGAILETATFASSVQHLHPIERKPLYHFRPGQLALTLAAPGCTFRCDYCQNARLSQYGRDPAAAWNATPLNPAAVVAEAQAQRAVIALSYSEPTLAAEATLALWAEAQPAGVEIVWKTNGYITPEALRQVAPALAAVNIDLKAADEARHRRLTGAPLAPVLASLRGFLEQGVWVEISTPWIPGFNLDERSLTALAALIRDLDPDIPWHLLRFHPDYQRRGSPPTPPEWLDQARSHAQAMGLRHVYVERALGAAGRTTYCPQCRHEVVARELWAGVQAKLDQGRCPRCGTPIAGKW